MQAGSICPQAERVSSPALNALLSQGSSCHSLLQAKGYGAPTPGCSGCRLLVYKETVPPSVVLAAAGDGWLPTGAGRTCGSGLDFAGTSHRDWPVTLTVQQGKTLRPNTPACSWTAAAHVRPAWLLKLRVSSGVWVTCRVVWLSPCPVFASWC